MPELPEIARLARQMDAHLVGKTISAIQVIQPKSLNLSPDEFSARLVGATIRAAGFHGKWVQVDTNQGWLLINLGMGGEVLLVAPDALPDKRRVVLLFSDQTCLSINFWWFGYAHFAPSDELDKHTLISRLGPNAIDVTLEQFRGILRNQKGQVKAFLLDQSRIAGIGNAYIHDILFLAGIHPLRKMNTLSDQEVERLFEGIQNGLNASIAKNGAFYEVDLFGEKGGFQIEDILIGYHEGQACPKCGTSIDKIRTGGTSSFVCPSCQPL